ncbi:MAG: hypothetical protein OXG88_09650 [Gammaproteobacteria bacterium]|nr:hypothetical protein [Gammaproteobacteria bacterium]
MNSEDLLIHEIHNLDLVNRQPTLEKALYKYLELCLENYSIAHVHAFRARLGWSGKPPITLQEAGKIAGVTRERIRQLELRIKRSIRKNTPAVMSKIADELPEDDAELWSNVSERLRAKGITENLWSLQSVRVLMRHFGFDAWYFAEGDQDSLIGGIPASYLTQFQEYITLTRRMCRASGAVPLESIVQEVRDSGREQKLQPTNVPSLKLMLSCISDIEFLPDDYCWVTSTPTNRVRLINVTKKMLSVARPLNMIEIHRGLERKYSFRNKTGTALYDGIVPPIRILLALYERYAEFKVSADDRIDYNGDLDPQSELTRPEHMIYRAFMDSGKRILDRNTIKFFGAERGINMSSIEVELTYSPIVTKIQQNNWRLVGTELTGRELSNLVFKTEDERSTRRLMGKGFIGEDLYRIVLVIPRFVHNFVSSVPSEIGGLKLQAAFLDKNDVSLICKNGAIFGFGKFLTDSGYSEGDYLTITLDLKEYGFTWTVSKELPDLSFAGQSNPTP